ncbi:hypothetical protein D3C80_1058340 [compost metagenome]
MESVVLCLCMLPMSVLAIVGIRLPAPDNYCQMPRRSNDHEVDSQTCTGYQGWQLVDSDRLECGCRHWGGRPLSAPAQSAVGGAAGFAGSSK